jgi:hypothetical protein
MPSLFLKSNQKLIIAVDQESLTEFGVDSDNSEIKIWYQFPRKGGGHTGFDAKTEDIVEGRIAISQIAPLKLLFELDVLFKLKVIDRVLTCINEKHSLVVGGIGVAGGFTLFTPEQDKSIPCKIHKVDGEKYVLFEGQLGIKKTILETY